jgi:hypothetical protein
MIQHLAQALVVAKPPASTLEAKQQPKSLAANWEAISVIPGKTGGRDPEFSSTWLVDSAARPAE